MRRSPSYSRCATANFRRCCGSGRGSPSTAHGHCREGCSGPRKRWRHRSAGTWPPRSTSGSWPTLSSWRRAATQPGIRSALSPPPIWGWCPPITTRRCPPDTSWHPVNALLELAFDHGVIVLAGRERLRAKLSYTNIGFALAPPRFTISELRAVYRAALGHDVSATNLQRVLLRRGVLEQTGQSRAPGRVGGRPAALFRFQRQRLEITDQFAVLRPPG